MKDFSAIISSCKFGDLSVSEANKLIQAKVEQSNKDAFNEAITAAVALARTRQMRYRCDDKKEFVDKESILLLRK